MTRPVPAATRTLAVLRFLASQPRPVTAGAISRELGIPRSSLYHLLAVMEEERFVTHLPEEGRYGLGVAAAGLGSAYQRQDGLERLARPLVISLAEEIEVPVHLSILDGRETVYLLEQRPSTPLPLVTDVGVRLSAHLTASGRVILAHLPAAHVLALYPSPSDLPRRTGSGPTSLTSLRRLLAGTRRRGFGVEDGEVSVGYRSAAVAVFDHTGRPAAAIAATIKRSDADAVDSLRAVVPALQGAATTLTRRLRGTSPPTTRALASVH